jgi:hypothetical protein
MRWIVPAYTLVWMASSYFSGGYDKPFSTWRLMRGIIIGTVIISATYGFIDESLRYSRALILIGAAWAFAIMLIWRAGYHAFAGRGLLSGNRDDPRLLICGSASESERTLNMLHSAGADFRYIGFVSTDKSSSAANQVGDSGMLDQLVKVYRINEIIFCLGTIPVSSALQWMKKLRGRVHFKLTADNLQAITGSNSKFSAGDLYAHDFNPSILRSYNIRNKRVLDLSVCLVLLISFPVHFFRVKNAGRLWQNWWLVFINRKSWVGPDRNFLLPAWSKLKPGVLSPASLASSENLPAQTLNKLNLLYAREYSVYEDLRILRKCYSQLGS